jgi:dinuclear metal center YbgI/SA1388 family protein
VRHDIALYSCHLPLDLHPEVGNNAVLAKKLGMEISGWFGEYNGHQIGAWGELDVSREALASIVGEVLGGGVRLVRGGPERCRRVGIITGAAGASIRQAHEAGLDTFITGEGQHWTFFDAEELGVNALFAGHYATETLGIQALAAHVQERFQLPWVFIDHPTGF